MVKNLSSTNIPTLNFSVAEPGPCATLAALLEATIPKPGNVHRAADFDNTSFMDFVVSAVAIGGPMRRAPAARIGTTVLESIRATRACVTTNTNLGLVLLLAPLARASAAGSPLTRERVAAALTELTPLDAADVYAAIRLAQPAGLGETNEWDIANDPPADLMAAMRSAADRDLVARQYAYAFEQVFEEVARPIAEAVRAGQTLTEATIYTHVQMMRRWPDSLIARKGGAAMAKESARRAAMVLEAGHPPERAYYRALEDFDFWLRSDGRRRNPGTTADLIGAGLYVVLYNGWVSPPLA
jgi:triphosphoribosyl-dephospho-CoA synthase